MERGGLEKKKKKKKSIFFLSGERCVQLTGFFLSKKKNMP